jgi:hypothetical protein
VSDTIQPGDPSGWQVPPDGEFGVAVPLRLEFVRTDGVAFAVVGIVAYSSGFSFQFSLRLRVPHELFLNSLPARGDLRLSSSWKPPGLGLDIEFTDGRRSVGGGVFPWPSDPAGRREAVVTLPLSRSGGGNTGRSWNNGVWVGPLPPPGPLFFVYEWPAEGIALTRREIDAQPIIDAAGRSVALW